MTLWGCAMNIKKKMKMYFIDYYKKTNKMYRW